MAVHIIDALKEPERNRNTTKNIKRNGDINLDDIIEITRVIKPRSMAKEIQGMCVSIDSKDPGNLQQYTFGASSLIAHQGSITDVVHYPIARLTAHATGPPPAALACYRRNTALVGGRGE
ncbi:hypothetical protein GOBAR_AA23270 [Gossypium barbadense]|uniref:Large ribosomal subunit protein uL11 C-terminal domain-containing protein n=1 Tax=Gossypium barbadense TaxID=3634 RepID=A0A2P5X243_GOSBA|nr:hypothetical protein GOBAR_AA23270 [Gossypium barbadense]